MTSEKTVKEWRSTAVAGRLEAVGVGDQGLQRTVEPVGMCVSRMQNGIKIRCWLINSSVKYLYDSIKYKSHSRRN
jgi:hypothetical protein